MFDLQRDVAVYHHYMRSVSALKREQTAVLDCIEAFGAFLEPHDRLLLCYYHIEDAVLCRECLAFEDCALAVENLLYACEIDAVYLQSDISALKFFVKKFPDFTWCDEPVHGTVCDRYRYSLASYRFTTGRTKEICSRQHADQQRAEGDVDDVSPDSRHFLCRVFRLAIVPAALRACRCLPLQGSRRPPSLQVRVRRCVREALPC